MLILNGMKFPLNFDSLLALLTELPAKKVVKEGHMHYVLNPETEPQAHASESAQGVPSIARLLQFFNNYRHCQIASCLAYRCQSVSQSHLHKFLIKLWRKIYHAGVHRLIPFSRPIITIGTHPVNVM